MHIYRVPGKKTQRIASTIKLKQKYPLPHMGVDINRCKKSKLSLKSMSANTSFVSQTSSFLPPRNVTAIFRLKFAHGLALSSRRLRPYRPSCPLMLSGGVLSLWGLRNCHWLSIGTLRCLHGSTVQVCSRALNKHVTIPYHVIWHSTTFPYSVQSMYLIPL
jgi:hypothetical protein